MNPKRQSRRRDPSMPLLVAASLVVVAGAAAVVFHLLDLRLGAAGALIFVPLAVLLLWSARHVRSEWAKTRENEKWLATTLRSIADAVITTDRAGRITFMNPEAERLTGWPVPEAHGQSLPKVFRLIDRTTREPIENPALTVMREGAQSSQRGSKLLLMRDNTELSVADNAAPIRDKDGEVIGVVHAFRDVTEKELGDSLLRATQDLFKLITDNTSDLIAVLDLEGRRLYLSPSYGRMIGNSENFFLGSSFESVHPEDRDRVQTLFADTVRTGVGQRTEYRLLRKDGGSVYIESVGSVIRGTGGQVEKVLVVSRDIAERLAASEHLQREKEFNDKVINSLPGAFYLRDGTGKLLRWNKNLEAVTGYNGEELQKLAPAAFFPPEDRALIQDRMLKTFAEGYADAEVRLLTKDGTMRPYYLTGVRIEMDGKHCILGMGIDITARVRAEETLLATMRRLGRQNAVLGENARSEAITDGDLPVALRKITEIAANTLELNRVSIWFYNEDHSCIRCADLYERDRRRHSEGAELCSADHPGYFKALAEDRAIDAHDARSDPRTHEFAATYLVPLGITSMLDAPIHSAGKMVGVLCHEHTGPARAWTPDERNFAGSMADLISLSMQVAHRREAEAALREARDDLERKVIERTRDLAEANDQLKELDRLKSEFLATMSHELRTPLNSIIGFTGILRQGLAGPLNDEQKKQLGMVQYSGKHLLGLINGLLDLSRIESGKMDIAHERFLLSEVVKEVVQSLQPMIDQKSLRIETQLHDPSLELVSDRKKCFQILLNLMNNAVKFTEKGEVRIETVSVPSGVNVTVSDTGIGIQAEHMDRLFEAFRQVDGSARRVYEGTGLGLYLCRKLVTLLGGSICAESEFGVGSRFTFMLPVEHLTNSPE